MPHSYTIPDLHGRHDLLIGALEAISARAQGDLITLVTLGDYVDKGPESRQVIEEMATLQRDPPAGWHVVCLKGNHDAMMRDAVRNPATLEDWLERGGDTALLSYGATRGQGTAAIPEPHVAWLESLALMYVDRHRVFVHAGVDDTLPLDRQIEQTLLWKRYPAGAVSGHESAHEPGHGVRHVVHGHDPFRNGPMLFPGRTNLDTLAWSTGRLVVGVFDDDVPGGPVDLIAIQGPAFDDLPRQPPPV
jgi:serine/threonine protein phosphatase 1